MTKSRVKTPKKAGRPAAGRTLSRDAIAEAAFRLIDREGLAAFSMRRLGQELGVEAMALYNHFEDKEALLTAAAGLLLARVVLPDPEGPWQARVRAICVSLRSLALRHPNLFRLAMNRPSTLSVALPLVESGLAAAAEAGLTAAGQASAYHTCFLYTRGFCLWEIDELGRSREIELNAVAAAADQYPRTAAAKKLIFAPNPARQFEAGLDLILRGIEATVTHGGKA
jgi:AcrR family transcriptional regulator